MDKIANSLTKVVSRTTNTATKAVTLEAAKFARFSNGACTCSLGDTSVLVTAVSQTSAKSPGSFVPLTVDYKQKAAAAGRIPMTHLRRDIGITETEVLISRMIDRSLRSSFPKGFYDDTQIICTLLAVDGLNDPDTLAINGASASLALSDIPWNGPIGAARIGLVGENLVVNPTRKEQENSRLNLIVSANEMGNIVMMEGSCNEPVLMPDVMKAMKQGVKECQAIIDCITKLQKSIGKPKKELNLSYLPTDEQKSLMSSLVTSKLKDILTDHKLDKLGRGMAISSLKDEMLEVMKEKHPDMDSSKLNDAFANIIRRTYTEILARTSVRCDGRQMNEMRPITCSVDLYKPLHGSALFQRGQTQVFCSTTFDSPDAAFRTDSITSLVSGVKEKNFMLHYEFPKFATNEIARVGSMPDRREIGHGALAEKSIRPLVPENHDMTIRLNCEVFESNGSSSMASVCAGSMSLMDAGVELKDHVAGVAMGLFGSEENPDTGKSLKKDTQDPDSYMILTDISGFEDFMGDMDFKISGTRKAITAFQLDVKPLKGISPNILYKAIQRAHSARTEIISKMEKAIREPRKEKKENHPVIKTIYVPQHKMSKFIGFGGSNLKKLMASIGVRVSSYNGSTNSKSDKEATVDQSNFIIFAPNKDAMEEAEEFIKSSIEQQNEPELEYNGIYTATIEELRPNGVMVTLYPNMLPTLLHVAQLDIKAVSHPSALNLEVGQKIQVKYFGRDPASGQMRLSRKSLMMSSTPRVRK